ncbi:MAG: alpha amylase C-terminal domain-containing protein [Rikenellaceae bacterium]
MSEKILPIISNDGWLEPVADIVTRRHTDFVNRLQEIENNCGSLSEYANSYLYFGLHYNKRRKGWIFREWLPNAKDVYICGDFNNWQHTSLRLTRIENGVWEIFLPDKSTGANLTHKSLYKIVVHSDNGFQERIPSHARYLHENLETHNYSACVWNPEEPFKWTDGRFKASKIGAPIIYEAHVGMAQEQDRIGSYKKFTRDIIPRVKELGYNTIQLMAIAEHPYYGSFGYHVSNFFAPSCRYGTPDELKELVNTAHKNGIAVVMDIVHSHFVKNTNEGLNELDGTNLYARDGAAGDQPYWDSKNFNYSRPEVEHFLLSNIKYWMNEFHFDGFRFDGVTSMLYKHFGYTDFGSYDSFFGDQVNDDAILYLTLASKLVHDLKDGAITIAEDVSGMPGMTVPVENGGMGLDYRLGMNIPDYWIDIIENTKDEDWDIWEMWEQMSNRLPWIKTIAYAESHDQSMVGDKTIAFRLMDKEMYYHMCCDHKNVIIDRGIALHKLIRLFTISTGGHGYLNFFGNEFGHPEWVDFPREGNGFSYEMARRQWSLASNGFLRYKFLQKFDIDMLKLVKDYNVLDQEYGNILNMDVTNKTMVYTKSDLVFIINWSPSHSIADYKIPVPEPGVYQLVMSTDDVEYGGFGRTARKSRYFTVQEKDERHYLRIYNTNRSAIVLKKEK